VKKNVWLATGKGEALWFFVKDRAGKKRVGDIHEESLRSSKIFSHVDGADAQGSDYPKRKRYGCEYEGVRRPT